MMISLALLMTGIIARAQEKNNNPFFSEFTTTFGVPPFDKIDTSHYVPAFTRGIAEQQAEIDAIVNNPAKPDFANTIEALDRSGALLARVGSVFYALNSANTNATMQDIARRISPMTTTHSDNIMLNGKLFQRIKSVYENRLQSNLDEQQIRVTEKYYTDFVRNGANLNDADQEKLRKINQDLSELQLKFSENLLAETNTNFKLVVENKADLKGLPEDAIMAAATAAEQCNMKGNWVFTLQKPSMLPFLQYAENRALREKLYRGYFMRGNNNDAFDNKESILGILNLRSEKAKLLGYKTYAHYTISNNMAGTPEKVYEFLYKVMKPATASAEKDKAEMQAIIDKEGGNFKLASWDWWFYAEKLRKEKYNLEESELKPYFVLENVRQGMFNTASSLYNIKFVKRTDLPVYHPEVEVFEITEMDGQHLGILYLDFHPRPGKRVGAWCGDFREQSYKDGKRITPIITVVCNFTRPSGDVPALLTWDEVNTMFHEFGHALHGLFSDGKYRRTAGSLARDMVELPSQIMENWASEPKVMNGYAKHYKTGEVIPAELMDRLQKSLTFNEGFATVEYVAASLLDLDLHSFDTVQNIDILKFESESMTKAGLINEIIPRYRTTYFNHIIGGYAAGYYVYLWAAVLDTDAFNAFAESGNIFDPATAAKFRKYILTEGGNNEGMVQYLKFRGKEPSIEPLLKKRGLN